MTDNVNGYPGLFPCGVDGQGAYTGTRSYYVCPAADGTAVYRYQTVKLDGGADAATGLPTVIAAGDTDTPVGIVDGMVPDPNYPTQMYRVASTRRILLVADDPNIHFLAVGDDAGTTLDAAHAGNNLTQESTGITSSTLSGNSNHRLDSSTVATTNTLPIRIQRLYSYPGQNITDGDKYKTWVCSFNLHQKTSTTGV